MSSIYSIFNLVLKERITVSTSLVRCVFESSEVHKMRRHAPDQRIKLLFPQPSHPAMKVNEGSDWYSHYMSIPKEERPLMRTYTLRALRIEDNEMDVEFVLHGKNTPVSDWLSEAKQGAPLQIVAPKEASDSSGQMGGTGGCEWVPPEQVNQVLLIADETALPAALGILEELALHDSPPKVQAFFEVPVQGDCLNLEQFKFANIFWLPRDVKEGYGYGERLLEAVREHVVLPESAFIEEQSLSESVSPDGILWERAENEGKASHFYGWVAAESTAVKNLRRYLLQERHLDKKLINFMAYWAKSSKGHH
ncbi:vibriobactin utilization protein ViuB [Xenorhabdus mauleonii]|uniref:NADPH-dependent ferric siderophore reductase, contains FAD-binding and SIP domains n=1 Tax=Xenorhabdus mauleonii TaxID=351675 RepID=A0A1I3UVI1_9GAMM|nr:siderophore-interacting protein [Xenorhabdus mauleonii]PHM37968.1 vibriobactin utilization protein ViuB [Xenorhabdus mauleonii]SFJ86753.1 NADPH-dependent ferric siderophore reductase, contains FAD-binding and SIP domains [Xenorhabdus mauleonii]